MTTIEPVAYHDTACPTCGAPPQGDQCGEVATIDTSTMSGGWRCERIAGHEGHHIARGGFGGTVRWR